MIYRESGQFKETYAEDMRIFPIAQDRWGVIGIVVMAFLVIPWIVSEYWLASIMIPFLVYSLAALGLNILTGYCGLVSIGHAAFMAVGAYTTFNLMTRLHLPLLFSFFGSGLIAAGAGLIFGIPSLRIKGFYLAVATLAAQFTIEWVISHVTWISGKKVLGPIDTPPMEILGWSIDTPIDRYFLCLAIVIIMALFAKNLTRSEIGRSWMAVRDQDVAAEIIGINLFGNKLLAFAVSAFYAGIAGTLLAFVHLRSVEITEFNLFLSFRLLGMIIIGGLGSILGSFLGAAFIVLLPILINRIVGLFSEVVLSDLLSNLELMIFGGLIIFFLIVEPYGLARLWQTVKTKLRLWPFPY
jgi:branched-chain amino acid transport system permease protein